MMREYSAVVAFVVAAVAVVVVLHK